MNNYSYPIDTDWTTEEIVLVTHFYNAVESAYEGGIELDAFKHAYYRFKQIVTSISEEKQVGNKFEAVSGYSIYRTVKEMKRLLKEPKLKSKQLIKVQQKNTRRS